jgi:hypothetical protein
MSDIWYGGKYERGLDVADIAKRVRADLKAAVKAGELPKSFKAGVRISRFSGGCSITVTIKVPGVPAVNPARVEFEHDHPHTYCDVALFTEEYTALKKKVEAILKAYNFDGSDTQTDYFHVNFYGSVSLDYDAEKAEKAELLAMLKLRAEREVAPLPLPAKPRVAPKATAVAAVDTRAEAAERALKADDAKPRALRSERSHLRLVHSVDKVAVPVRHEVKALFGVVCGVCGTVGLAPGDVASTVCSECKTVIDLTCA